MSQPGTYEFHGDDVTVHVIAQQGLIWFEISDSAGKLKFVEPAKSNQMMKWYSYWESKTRTLWRYSGDIGVSAWRVELDGGSVSEVNTSEVDNVPKVFVDEMSGTSRKVFLDLLRKEAREALEEK